MSGSWQSCSDQSSQRVAEWVRDAARLQAATRSASSGAASMPAVPPPPHRPLPPGRRSVSSTESQHVPKRPMPPLRPGAPVPLERVAIIVHGGAWSIPNDRTDASLVGVRRAALAGHAFLLQPENHHAALDAVEAAGPVLNEDGKIEMDAAIMEGRFLRYGAVAGLSGCVRNPITVARAVMELTEHCMLVGAGADRFALRCASEGIVEPVQNERAELMTPEALAEWKRHRLFRSAVRDWFGGGFSAVTTRHPSTNGSLSRSRAPTPGEKVDTGSRPRSTGTADRSQPDRYPNPGHDTVGAVAIDNYGNLAAATSTGGITSKMVGRVGDAPLIGCGCYGDNAIGAVSATGHGESIMRIMLAARVCSLLQSGLSAQEAARDALRHMDARVGGRGGVIVITKNGDLGVSFTTERMVWASISDGVMRSGIDEDMSDCLESRFRADIRQPR
ncbi:Taspase, threonine aspartase, 1 [Cyanidiococcus yangmingshanensis]|uniref:Taspase, threonine aspartase, 1 n=1 Tax=Cyanidiococcus yangmingshanensis TaxID=2690220 RepID=A0A7J7IH66_9RHOD|nr:Taspase, threonine aspartase, 1 [Cyanidiococcus yangmingshanensis]